MTYILLFAAGWLCRHYAVGSGMIELLIERFGRHL